MATSRIEHVYPAASTDFGATVKSTSLPNGAGERTVRQVRFVVTDLLAVWLSASIALGLRFQTSWLNSPGPLSRADGKSLGGHIGVLLLYSGLIVLFCNTQRLYCGLLAKSTNDEVWDIGKAVGLATVLQLGCIYLSGLKFISRFVIVFTMVASFLGLV